MPQLGDRHAMVCRHYATSVSRVYGELAARADTRELARTAVLFVMGVPSCDGPPGLLHAWNWLVDFGWGKVWTFDPQNVETGTAYANVSSLLYTFAVMKKQGWPVPNVRAFVRRFESVHGGTTLFHLARHPISRGSRRAIVDRLRASHFERIVPTWQAELEAHDGYWGNVSLDVEHIVRYADG